MNLFTRITNAGISILFGDKDEVKPETNNANQKNPRRYYVYAHLREDGTPFYIGKGTARRAWKKDNRHSLWHRYVDNHLNGEYSVKILIDDLDSDDAEDYESDWIAEKGDTLVNWVNFGRKTDYKALERLHESRDASRGMADRAKQEEANNLEKAVEIYQQAIAKIEDYAFIQYEGGLVGQLMEEEAREDGVSGDINILNRLTICLNKLKRKDEAKEIAIKYFDLYKRDSELKSAEAIKKRVGIL